MSELAAEPHHPTPAANVQWGGFLLRLAAGCTWLIGAGSAAAGLGDVQSPLWVRAWCVLGIIVPPVVWMSVVNRRVKALDQLEARIELSGLVRGAMFAIMLGASSFALPALINPANGLLAALVIAWLAPTAYIFAEVMIQLDRRKLATGETVGGSMLAL